MTFFMPVLGRATGGCVTLGAGDITVTSVFSTRRERILWRLSRGSSDARHRLPTAPHRSAVRLWFTGENIRAPLNGFDLTLSFDPDEYGGSNVYLPLAIVGLRWFDSTSSATEECKRAGAVLHPRVAAEARRPVAAERTEFACAFIGNPEPRRMRAIEALSRYRPVDVFGAAVGRPVAEKASIARQYRYVVCFENDLFPGYVSEKPVEAYATGAIPLWSGLDEVGILHRQGVVNQADFSYLSEWVDHVADLDRTHSALVAAAAAPLFSQEPSLDKLISRLSQVLDS